MKLLGCFIGLVMLSLVNSHPVKMICIPSCNVNVTANEEFVKEWLNNSNNTGIHQLRNSMGTIVSMLMIDAPRDISDCKDIYNSFVTTPESTDVSTDTIRGFFNAYLLHKYFVDYLVNLHATKLVDKNWVYQGNVTYFYGYLSQLQNALNFNAQKLYILLNTTCDACISNSTKSAADNGTLITAVEEKCKSPIYEVISTIATHSEKLFMMIDGWQDAVSDNSTITAMANTDQDINDLHLCDIPVKSKI